LQGLRLESLPASKAPGGGLSQLGGDFALTHIAAAITPPGKQSLRGRFVRIEIPGKGKHLSLAEGQVFRGAANISNKGEARQSSTAYDAPAKLAIDGNTDGRFFVAHSTTHTAVSENPWWEVDLKAEQPLDRIVIWNRTDPGTEDRLNNFRISVLNEKRQ